MFTEESRLSPLSEDALYATLLKHVPFIPLLCIPCRGEGKVTRCSSPSYEIVESDEHYQIVVDLPVIEGKLHAKVEHGRRVLHIVEEVFEGRTLSSDDGRKRFEMRFLLGCNVNANQISVEFEDAVLTVTAGKIAVEGNEGSSTINLPVLEHHLHPLKDDHAKDALLAKESYNERFEEAH